MSLQEIDFKDTYWSGENNLINEFYIPCLENSTEYCRAVGYFSSSILCYISNGLYPFIKNGGRMRIICSVNLSEQDEKDIALGYDIREKISAVLNAEIDKLLEFNIANVKNLCWLIKQNRLDIRVCLRKTPISGSKLFHEKFGVFTDGEGNRVSFLGSVNETIGGWLNNEESFEVSQSWIPALSKRVQEKADRFERLWDGNAANIETHAFPDAARQKLIQHAPAEPQDYVYKVSAGIHGNFRPRNCQDNAKNAFLMNDFCCLFMMATGSGKTKAAMYAMSQIDTWKLLLICVPSMELVEQWEGDVRLFYPDIRIIKCSSAYSEAPALIKALAQAKFPGQTVVISTYDSAIKDSNMIRWKAIKEDQFALICDEVHNIGAPSTQRIMDLNPRFRIGLSATPKRNFDEEGSEKILNYYQHHVYEFTIKEAQREGYLVEYDYHLIPSPMAQEDWISYVGASRRIKKYRQAVENSKKAEDKEKYEKKLKEEYRTRASILKKCDSKTNSIETIYDEIPENSRTLIYGEDITHLDILGAELDRLGKRYFKYIGTLDAQKHRPTILEEFKHGIRKTLLAVGCLDEGIDIPACDVAVFVSSSTSERQFIQRRGRVLRTAPGKRGAQIYDYLVYPNLGGNASDEERDLALNMIESQYRRIELMMDDAINGAQEQQKNRAFLSSRGLNPFEY